MKIRRTAVLAGVVVTAAAAAALVAVPALAANGAREQHVLRFNAVPVAAQAHSYNKVQGLEFDRDLQGKKLIGENIVDFVTATTSDVSVALRGGFLDGHFTVGPTGKISGRITGGSGRFAGDTGTIGGEATPTVARVVLTYRR